MTDRELMQMALDALEAMQSYARAEKKGLRICDESIEALRERLAQPEHEPVAYVSDSGSIAVMVAGTDIDDDTPLYTAPPSFNRNASLTEDRYVCDCEYWEPPVDAVNMSQERVDETAKRKHEPMNDRERLETIVNVICRYLPPSGIDIKTAMSEIIELVDPLPPKREWVGLTENEFEEVLKQNNEAFHFAVYKQLEAKLKEKNG